MDKGGKIICHTGQTTKNDAVEFINWYVNMLIKCSKAKTKVSNNGEKHKAKEMG